jgi:enoyl-CoA hydratase/carnithine racemase
MELVQVEYRDEVAVLKLQRGVTNPFNLEFVKAISEQLDGLRDNPAASGIVLTGSNRKFFSIGFDIPELIGLSREDFSVFYRSYNQLCLDLFALPKPTIAAITGHAIAGGCILALCCDYRFIAEGRKLMGVNEIKLGVPIPYPGDCILQQLAGYQVARDMNDTGEFYEAEELYGMGVVDAVLPIDRVLPDSIKKVASIAAHPSRAFAQIKRNRVEMVEARIRQHLAQKEEYFIECWYSPESRDLLQEAVERF